MSPRALALLFGALLSGVVACSTTDGNTPSDPGEAGEGGADSGGTGHGDGGATETGGSGSSGASGEAGEGGRLLGGSGGGGTSSAGTGGSAGDAAGPSEGGEGGSGEGGAGDTGGSGGGGEPIVWPMPMPNPPGIGLPNPASYTDLDNGTVLDEVTGLEWEDSAGDHASLFDSLSYCDQLVSGGYDDWRLPTRLELVTRVDFTRYGPAHDPVHFPDEPHTPFFSRTPVAGADNQGFNWAVTSVSHGETEFLGQLFGAGRRCVRGGRGLPEPSAHFRIGAGSRSGVVLDRQTGLVWQRVVPAEAYDWEHAGDYCANLRLGGFRSFRLPSMKELQTIIDDERSAPAIDRDVYPEAPAENFWSSSLDAFVSDFYANDGFAWFVSFVSGISDTASGNLTYRVRCVAEDDGLGWPVGLPDPCEGVSCSEHGSCAVVNGRAECTCDAGFIRGTDSRVCADVNECAIGNGGCDARVSCTNLPGGKLCGTCPPGHEGNGIVCTPISACPCEGGGVCVVHGGGYACDCPPGFVGRHCEQHFIQAASGSSHTCGILSGGGVRCWGRNIDGESTPPVDAVDTLTVGDAHACALRNDGSVACWGRNGSGQTTAPNGTFVALGAGPLHTCGVRADASVVCWGLNTSGQATAPAGSFSTVAAGATHSCALRTDQRLSCWGASAPSTIPAQFANTAYQAVSLRDAVTCALRSDGSAIDCFTTGWSTTYPGSFRALAADCALRSDGTLYCFHTWEPPSGAFVGIWGNRGTHCALRTDGVLVCFGGSNQDGHRDPPSGAYRRVSPSTSSAFDGCAIRADESLFCWNKATPSGNYSEIGSSGDCGTRTDGSIRCSPWGDRREFVESGPFTELVDSFGSFCALDVEGRLVCRAHGGQPKGVPSGRFNALSMFEGHQCALDVSGRARCWPGGGDVPSEPFTAIGSSRYGSCAIRAADQSLVCWSHDGGFVASPPSGTFRALSRLADCAIRTDGTLACWPLQPEPWYAPPSGTFETVNGGCAIDTDMALRCWGYIVR